MLAAPGAVGRSVIVFAIAASQSIAHADRLVDTREVVRGEYLQPRWSPDGRELLVTGPQLQGLVIVGFDRRARVVSTDAEAGVHARWSADGAIELRVRRGATRHDLVLQGGVARSASPPAPLAFAKDDLMYVVDRAGKLVRIGSGDRFFGAVVAPDRDKVVFQGLQTGLYLHVRSTGVTRYIGPGTAPAWSPDSTRIVYEVTEDDGHEIVASELFVYTVATDRAVPITATDRVVERRPSFSPDGGRIAFDDHAGGIFVGEVR